MVAFGALQKRRVFGHRDAGVGVLWLLDDSLVRRLDKGCSTKEVSFSRRLQEATLCQWPATIGIVQFRILFLHGDDKKGRVARIVLWFIRTIPYLFEHVGQTVLGLPPRKSKNGSQRGHNQLIIRNCRNIFLYFMSGYVENSREHYVDSAYHFI